VKGDKEKGDKGKGEAEGRAPTTLFDTERRN